MEIAIFGQDKVLDGDRDLTPGRAKQRALLAMLLLHPNEMIASDQLVEALWDEAPPLRLGGLLRRVVDPVVAPLLADADEVAAWELDWERPDPRPAGGQHDAHWLARAAALRQLVPGTLDPPGVDGCCRWPGRRAGGGRLRTWSS